MLGGRLMRDGQSSMGVHVGCGSNLQVYRDLHCPRLLIAYVLFVSLVCMERC